MWVNASEGQVYVYVQSDRRKKDEKNGLAIAYILGENQTLEHLVTYNLIP